MAEPLENRGFISNETSPEQLLRSEQVKIAYAALVKSMMANIFNSTVLGWMLWPVIDHATIVGWWCYIVVISLMRGADSLLYRKQQGMRHADHWMRRLAIGAGLSAFGWGASSLLLFADDSIAHQVLLAFVIAGMAAGSTVMFTTQRETGMTYLMLLLVPVAIQFFRLGSDIALAMGVMTLLYLGVLLSFFRSINNNTLQNIRLRIESSIHEAQMAASEQELRKLSRAMEYAGESIFITNADGVIEYINPAFTALTGFNEQEAIGSNPSILKSGKQDEAFYREFWGTIKSGHVWQGKLINRRKDGSLYTAIMTVAPISDEQNKITHYVAMQRDISKYEELEARFLQAQKMDAIGTLVGGIAHDFNNMLAALTANLYLAKSDAKENPALLERLERMNLVSQRASDMISQLLTFARKGKVEMHDVSLVSFLKEVFKLARPSIPENIEMKLQLPDNELVVQGDVTQLQQVLLNLITNASHAVEQTAAPEIVIRLQRFEPDQRFLESHSDIAPGSLVLITISDNGCGIEAEYLDKVFDPFFTTKETGKGTGLGLAMVHGAMQTHHGAVDIHSEVGNGTSVSLYLPLLSKPSEHLTDREPLKAKTGLGEGILLVDDDASLREVNAELLKNLGYHLFVAENGRHAQTIYAANADAINLAVVDMVMPKMGGLEFASWLRQQDAQIPIIFLTGYDRDHALSNAKVPDNSVLMTKPVDVVELSHQIRKMLGNSTAL